MRRNIIIIKMRMMRNIMMIIRMIFMMRIMMRLVMNLDWMYLNMVI